MTRQIALLDNVTYAASTKVRSHPHTHPRQLTTVLTANQRPDTRGRCIRHATLVSGDGHLFISLSRASELCARASHYLKPWPRD